MEIRVIIENLRGTFINRMVYMLVFFNAVVSVQLVADLSWLSVEEKR